jgi:hypothetical protein
MPTRLKQFVRSLQRSNETRKRRRLVGTSAVTMLIVVVLWLAYLNLIVPVLSPRESIGIAALIAPVEGADSSFIATLGRGLSAIGSSVQSKWSAMTEQVAPLFDSLQRTLGPKQTVITPTDGTSGEAEPIAP